MTYAADAFFDFDKSVLKPEGKAKLDDLVGKVKDIKELKDKGEWRVTIETGDSTVVVERTRIIRVGDVAAPPA